MTEAVAVERVSKRYRLGMRGAVPLPSPFPWRGVRDGADVDDGEPTRRLEDSWLWALRDVSFELPTGGALGVVGGDGAGKSTLLRILGGVTRPTEGEVRLAGRLAPPFDIATSLIQGDFDARGNVMLLAQLFGFPRRLAEERVAAITSFAGVDHLGETPVKRYSGGLHRRLAFATVAHFDPEIMIADEVVAVGDDEFRAECLDLVERRLREGMTLVLASRDTDVLQRLCERAIRLEQGRVVAAGSVDDVLREHERAAYGPVVRRASDRKLSFSSVASLVDAASFDGDGTATRTLRDDEEAVLQMVVETAAARTEIRCVFVLYVGKQPRIRLVQRDGYLATEPGPYTAAVRVPPGVLPPAEYVVRIGAWVTRKGIETPIVRGNVCSFEVDGDREPADDAWQADELIEITHLEWSTYAGDRLRRSRIAAGGAS